MIMTACNHPPSGCKAISAGRLPTGVRRSWVLFGLLSIPYSFTHLDSQALDHLISPADVLPLHDE
jgi:hypothetical protein